MAKKSKNSFTDSIDLKVLKHPRGRLFGYQSDDLLIDLTDKRLELDVSDVMFVLTPHASGCYMTVEPNGDHSRSVDFNLHAVSLQDLSPTVRKPDDMPRKLWVFFVQAYQKFLVEFEKSERAYRKKLQSMQKRDISRRKSVIKDILSAIS